VILTVLVGNTHTRFVWFRGRRASRAVTMPTEDAPAARLPGPGRVGAVGLASVVPGLTPRLAARLRACTGIEPLLVGPRTRTPLTYRYRRTELGADRVCVAVGAFRRFPSQDTIVFDFGTATTANVVLREGVFAGGAILPGIQMSFAALARGTAGLPKLDPGGLRSPVQHTTPGALLAGVSNLFAGGIERIIAQTQAVEGRRFRVVATGGNAQLAQSYSKLIREIRPLLANEGLASLCSTPG